MRCEIRCKFGGDLTSAASAESLRQLQKEIETFLTSLRHPVLVEDELELLDLTAAQWSMTLEPRGLLLQAWSPGRSISRRIEQLAYRRRGRLGVFVRKPGGRESATLELRDFDAPSEHSPIETCGVPALVVNLSLFFRTDFLGWRSGGSATVQIANTLSRPGTPADSCAREEAAGHFSPCTKAKTAVSDSALAYGLIWLDWLRGRSERDPVVGLKSFLPDQALAATCHRAAYLNRSAAQIEVWALNQACLTTVDLSDFGNVETRSARRSAVDELARRFGERHEEWLRKLLGEALQPRPVSVRTGHQRLLHPIARPGSGDGGRTACASRLLSNGRKRFGGWTSRTGKSFASW